MPTFYADNFRGFRDTYLDLTEVNFFVGENSSGKTSMLSLLRFLSEREFWIGSDLPARAGLGHFGDAVSIHSEDKSYFRIGAIEHNSSKDDAKSSPQYAATLLTFVNRDGLPVLKEYSCQLDDLWVQIDFGRKKPKARVRTEMRVPANPLRTFKDWSTARFLKGANTRELDVPKGIPLPLLFMVATDGLRKGARDLRPFEMVPWMASELVWLAPIRTKPKRTYDDYRLEFSAEGEHTPYLIRRLLSNKKQAKHFQKFIARFGRESGLFESVRIKRHGRGETAPFELDIVLSSRALGVNNVGYGVSQSLPILVELFARPPQCAFAVQQPEVHLHPTAQAALGDVIFELAAAESKLFIIETHSDYLIDRFRLRQRKSKASSESRIFYFSRNSAGNSVDTIDIGDDGSLSGEQPQGYRKFFINEAIKLLELS